jgi:hypothetical protein
MGRVNPTQETTTVISGSNAVHYRLLIGNDAGQLQGKFDFGSWK